MRTGAHRWVAPEVVQTSVMDCGPASLKCVLEGFGVPVSYGRLREACQTDVDGTSIDAMEEIAIQLGLEAEQIVLPADFLLLEEAQALPAIVVVRSPNGATHFLVAWRRHGKFLQVMDPAIGRRWMRAEDFLSQVYIHTMAVKSTDWREWATSEKFLRPLRRKLATLRVDPRISVSLINRAVTDTAWHGLAALDAATRAVESMVEAGALRRDHEPSHAVEHLFERANKGSSGFAIPEGYWSVRPAPPSPTGEDQLLIRGAVLVRISGVRPQSSEQPKPAAISSELMAALDEHPNRPGIELLRLLRADGALAPAIIICASLLAATGVIFEAVLLRSVLDMPRQFGIIGDRLGVVAILLAFLAGLLLLEFPIASGLVRMGRGLEARLRIAFLQKIPLLGDQYFHSRLTSDMAERGHSIYRIRALPNLGGQLVRSLFELILTTVGIIWLDASAAWIAIAAAITSLALPLVAQPALAERDLRLKNHVGALSRFYLDALLGLVPIRVHGAERALRREHESLLSKWVGAGLGLQRLVVWIEGVQYVLGFGIAGWLLLTHVSHRESGSVLLLIYWTLNLPVIGEQIAQLAWQYPAHRNLALRLFEPLAACQYPSAAEAPLQNAAPLEDPSSLGVAKPGAAIALEGVSVRAAGHFILEDINLTLGPNTHVAIVGESGAGKSTLVAILLGWFHPITGRVLIDGELLDAPALERLRTQTAWVDPAVQLWNRSLFDNLRYGNGDELPTPALEQSGLRSVLQKLPDGLQAQLGESGALVSGGEGQRVRFARALLKRNVRLAILDEPFRGLDRQQRRELLSNARQHWRDSTLLCVTHDVDETLAFPRVIVVHAGRIVEDGVPAELAAKADSRYRAMLSAEKSVREGLWTSQTWRHWQLEGGRLVERAINSGL